MFYVYFPIRHNNALFLMSAAVHCNKLKVRTEYKDFIGYRPNYTLLRQVPHTSVAGRLGVGCYSSIRCPVFLEFRVSLNKVHKLFLYCSAMLQPELLIKASSISLSCPCIELNLRGGLTDLVLVQWSFHCCDE